MSTPLFPAPLFHEGNVIGHIRGPGPASLNGRHGRGNDPSLSESLLGRARGCFSGPVGVRDGTHQRGGRQSSQGILGTVTSSTRDQQAQISGRGSRHIEKGTSLARVQPSFVESPIAAARSRYRSGRDRRTALTKKETPIGGKPGLRKRTIGSGENPFYRPMLANEPGIDGVPLRHLGCCHRHHPDSRCERCRYRNIG